MRRLPSVLIALSLFASLAACDSGGAGPVTDDGGPSEVAAADAHDPYDVPPGSDVRPGSDVPPGRDVPPGSDVPTPPVDVPGADVPPCISRTCVERAVECGPSDDGCGNPLACGDCPDGGTCDGGVCLPPCADAPCGPLWSSRCAATPGYVVCGLDPTSGCPTESLVVGCAAGHTCADGACTGTCVVPEVMLLVDRSSSMAGATWDATRAAITAFATAYEGTAQLGLRHFPGSEGCTPGAVVPLARNNARALLEGLVPPAAAGSTPLAAALDGLAPHFGDPNEGEHVVVLSDGSETCVDPDEVIARARALRSRGTAVHALAIGAAADASLLGAMAEAGGGTFARVDDGEALEGRLRTLAGTLLGCPQPRSDGIAACRTDACVLDCDAGFHACGMACAPDDDVATCGTRCAPCPAVLHGRTTCDDGACGVRCDAGYHECSGACLPSDVPESCGSRCTPCPTVANATSVCRSGTCDFTCAAGHHRCGSTCLSDTSAASCGASCTPCPSDANGAATCEAGRCRLTCDPGFLLCLGDSACCTFTNEAVETSTMRLGTHADLAIDADGRPHVSYYAYAQDFPRLHHAVRETDGWHVDEVATALSDYADTSLAFGPDGLPRVAFEFTGTMTDTRAGVRLAELTSDGWWRVRTVLATNDVWGPLELALDADGLGYVAWLASMPDEHVTLATGRDSTWTVTTPITGTPLFGTLDLALDTAGTPHLAYCPNDEPGLRHATRTGDTWTVDTLSDDDWEWWATALAIDPQDGVHILALRQIITWKPLRYWHRDGGTFVPEEVDAGDIRQLDLAADATGRPHAAYLFVEGNTTELRYAWRAEGAWHHTTVTTSTEDLTDVAIATDAEGGVHIVYHEPVSGRLALRYVRLARP